MTTSPDTQRDELAQIIKREQARAVSRQRPSDAYDAPADAIFAAGYRKPRTTETMEEVDALREGSVVLDGDVCVRRADGYWKVLGLDGVYTSRDINLPATVLWEPEA